MDIGITTKKTPQLDSSIDTFVNLIDQTQSVHKIKTTLFSIFLPKLRELQSLTQESTNYDYKSDEYRVTTIILDSPVQVVQTCPQ